ncbi:hypothetical protein [Foetidibacter luteolus]|uniref:hypothetical protein n=1 Tax=Foetidibacter luteolus TaxID=2608880 RepID=UPI00129AC899|nr:hypothetical protein [Foetidibacter luteolus]
MDIRNRASQKGTLITGILDAVTANMEIFVRVSKKSKAEGLYTAMENEYIAAKLNGINKEGNQCLEKLKELITSRQPENEKLESLRQMYAIMQRQAATARHFEKGFARLSEARKKKLSEIAEVEKLFEIRRRRKNRTP